MGGEEGGGGRNAAGRRQGQVRIGQGGRLVRGGQGGREAARVVGAELPLGSGQVRMRQYGFQARREVLV